MSRRKRRAVGSEARRLNQEQCARFGAELRASRKRRRLTQQKVADVGGVGRATVSRLERGLGASLSLDTWQRVALVLDRPLRVEFGRDPAEEPADAGHLRVQELVLRLARTAGYTGSFELATKPSDPTRSTDVGLRHHRRRLLVLVECWNTIADIGAAARSSQRKQAEAEAFAIAVGGEQPHRVASVWVVRATQRNRGLVARYAEVFASRFPGSSTAWVRALTEAGEPPAQPGLVWADLAATRLFAWRRPGR